MKKCNIIIKFLNNLFYNIYKIRKESYIIFIIFFSKQIEFSCLKAESIKI